MGCAWKQGWNRVVFRGHKYIPCRWLTDSITLLFWHIPLTGRSWCYQTCSINCNIDQTPSDDGSTVWIHRCALEPYPSTMREISGGQIGKEWGTCIRTGRSSFSRVPYWFLSKHSFEALCKVQMNKGKKNRDMDWLNFASWTLLPHLLILPV